VKIEGVTIRNAPNYNISLLGTDYVVIDGVIIVNGYADGIDPDSCRNVRISNCHIECGDDAIALKSSFSLGEHRSCENITVTNCFLSTSCNCFKLGTESGGDFKHIAVDNCVMCGIIGDRPASSGIAIESVDGANVAGVTISNISMFDVCSPVFMRLGNRGRDMAVHIAGTMRDISISHLVVEDASLASTIAGIPDHPIEDLSLSDIRVSYRGDGMLRPVGESVPENVDAYPDPDMFGLLPADGVYVRHVRGLRLTDVNLQIRPGFWRLNVQDDSVVDWHNTPPTHSNPDTPKTEVVIEDADDLQIHNFICWNGAPNLVQIRLRNVQNALLDICRAGRGNNHFLEISGNRSNNIELSRCDTTPRAVIVVDGAVRSAYSIR
jgi:hypothetical protein